MTRPSRKFAIAIYILLVLSLAAGGIVSFAEDTASPGQTPQAQASPLPQQRLAFRPQDPLTDAGFEHFYNLDYDQAIQDFERVLDKHANDPFAVNHLLTAVLIRELYRMGAMNTGEYANDSFIGQVHHPADPKIKARIKELVQRAEKLEQAELKANSKDIDALYARGVTRAQFSVYTALVERAWFSALRNAVGARHDHEKVLELNPAYTDAKLVVGSHNYVVGSLPWGVKVAVSLVGISGNKEKGFRYLYDAAGSTDEVSVDAKVVLMLFLRREHRYDEALKITRSLIPRFPQNGLFLLEEGNLLRVSGKKEEAAAVYRKVWQNGREGRYPVFHYETAALSLGDMLRDEKDYSGAAAAYELGNTVPQPDHELLQRANLAAGEMYDLMQKRDMAVKKYQAVIATNAQTPPAEMARKYMKEAYRNE